MNTSREQLQAENARLKSLLAASNARAADALREKKGAEQLAADLKNQNVSLKQKLADKNQELADNKQKLAEKKKELADKIQQVALFVKCLKEALPAFKAFAEKLTSRMTDDPEWNQIITQDFLRSVAQLDALRHDCSVLKKRVNRGGEKLKSLPIEPKALAGDALAIVSKLVASGAHQVANAQVVNALTIRALEASNPQSDTTGSIATMLEIAHQKLSSEAQERQKEDEKTGLSLGRQIPEREELPEKTVEPAEVPPDLSCPVCGGQEKFHVIRQPQASKMLSVIEDFVQVLKVNLLETTYAECAHCGTVQPIFNMNAPMALNPKRELSIETLTASVGLVANGVPLNRVENMFFKDMQTGSSTLSENLHQMAKYATPLIERIEAEAHKADVIIADETPFDVLQAEGRGHQVSQSEATSKNTSSQTYIQAVTSTTAADKRFTLFYPMAGRSAKEISAILNAFTPKTIMSDGYAAYTGIVRESSAEIGHASCLVHWRRELLKAANLETQCSYVKRTTPEKALTNYRQHIEENSPLTILNMTLCALSRVFAEEQSVVRGEGETYDAYLLRVKAHREKYIEPYMDWIDKLMTILKEKAKLVPGKTGKYKDTGEGALYYVAPVVYYLNRRDELRYFLTHPACPPSSNNVEARIRPITIIRNNINFLQNMEYAQGLCRLLSLVETAKANGIENPVKWLTEYYYRLARYCQRKQWIDSTRPNAAKRKDPYKKFVKWEYDKYWGSMPIEDLLPWNYKPADKA